MSDTLYKLLAEIEKIEALVASGWSDTIQHVHLKELFELCKNMREGMAR